jgi:hypothetical protein
MGLKQKEAKYLWEKMINSGYRPRSVGDAVAIMLRGS